MYLSSSYSRFGVGYGADAQTGLFYWCAAALAIYAPHKQLLILTLS
jgi:hypothetical protein